MIRIHEKPCIGCENSLKICPVDAIEPMLKACKANSVQRCMDEQHGNMCRPTGPELLGKGRELADKLREQLCAALLGDEVLKLCDELAAYGAEKVYVI
ncbi:MAG: hypothetical protein R6U17_10045 [Thermoplasmata archaeon]